jgi:hypothetical protein
MTSEMEEVLNHLADVEYDLDSYEAGFNAAITLLDSPEMVAMVERIISHRSAAMWTAQELIREIKKAMTGGDDAAQ